MSTTHTRNKMDDKIHEYQFYFVANARLLDNSEQTEISQESNTVVNIAASFHIFIQIIGHTNETTAILTHDHR